MIKSTIEFEESGLCKIITDNNKIKKERYISIKTLKEIVDSAASSIKYVEEKNSKIYKTPLFKDCKDYKYIQSIYETEKDSTWHILLRKKISCEFIYKTFKKKINMPYILFCIKTYKEKCMLIRVYCVKSENINYDTKLYNYPFSNVYDSGAVCLGSNSLSNFYINDDNVTIIPNMFLAMDNSNHSYNEYNNNNLTYEELLEHLVINEFDDNMLKVSKIGNYENLINKTLK